MGILSIFIGYLLGSILPAYFFGRLKGIDIRKEGTCNPGTSNAFRTLGLKYAIPTAIYDTLKGLLVIFIAQALGANFIFAQISGIATIVGHLFPFYLKFRGGQGVATATGIMLFYISQYFLMSMALFYFLWYLMIIVIIFAYVTKRGRILAVVVLPLLGYSVFVYYPTAPFNIFFCIVNGHIILIGIYLIITGKIFNIQDENFKTHWWRVALRPCAILFLVFYILFSQIIALILIGSVSIAFIALDISRFMNRNTNVFLTEKVKSLFKKDEIKKFSSMTLFLIAGFITILLFEMNVAFTAMIFLIFGDMFSKIFGLNFGRTKIFTNKTLEGTLAYFGCVLICGYILYTTLDLPLLVLILGCIAAPLAELLPLGVDDNFSVPLISGAVMTVALFFGL